MVFLKSKLILFFLFTVSVFLPIRTAAFFQEDDKNYQEFKGKVLDETTKAPLASVHLFIEDSNVNTVSNSEGDFLFKIPNDLLDKNITISFLGYENKSMAISNLTSNKNSILLRKSAIKLDEVSILTIADVDGLVKEVFKNKGANYIEKEAVMTAFYRETIKKKRKNISLSEAIVNIYKSPYSSKSDDVMEFYKTRKKTNYAKLDTLALKLQGGPFNTLFVDVIKYPEFLFSEASMVNYDFTFSNTTTINENLVHVIHFKNKPGIEPPFYEGDLFIDVKNKVLISADFAMGLEDKNTSSLLLKKKPTRSEVVLTKATYKVNYNERNNKWYYAYSNVDLALKIKWRKKLFNSKFSLSCEMAVTDWKENLQQEKPINKKRIKPSIVMADYAIGFSDPNFWGAYNIIEPDKSIERAIHKIQKHLEN